MPPAEMEPMPKEEIALIRRWIEAGGAWEPHWAFAPFRAVEPPRTQDSEWARNPIDRFVLARLEAARKRVLVVGTKADLPGAAAADWPPPVAAESFRISARTGEGVEALIGAVVWPATTSPGSRWATRARSATGSGTRSST